MADTIDHLLNILYLSQKEIWVQVSFLDFTFRLISFSTSASFRSDLSDIVLTEISLTKEDIADFKSESSRFCLS